MDTLHITVDLIKNALDYDPETGVFEWKSRFGKRGVHGRVSGAVDFNGYLQAKAELHTFNPVPRYA